MRRWCGPDALRQTKRAWHRRRLRHCDLEVRVLSAWCVTQITVRAFGQHAVVGTMVPMRVVISVVALAIFLAVFVGAADGRTIQGVMGGLLRTRIT